jgi:superfamily II DNA or RNA helicase
LCDENHSTIIPRLSKTIAMTTQEKRILTSLNTIPSFQNDIEALTIERQLPSQEKSYLLASAMLLLRHYQQDNSKRSFLDLSYYIILKYSITYQDYRPLYDFAVIFGFYPIVKFIIDKNLLPVESISQQLISLEIEKFRSDSHIETLHQHVEKRKLLSDASKSVGYVAPTSFGKSSVIIDYIRNSPSDLKVAIIVPTKSLLMQTYRMIRNGGFNRKILIHDEMFQGEETFIAVFTQERALRLLRRKTTYFDLIFIDEAHNILKDDPRSILLSRLIRRNSKLNPSHKLVYLSPLIEDLSSLKMSPDEVINEHKIEFNIKEPEIFEVRLDNSVHKYNRFVNKHYYIRDSKGIFPYIIETAGKKNFLYNYRPVNIEKLARELASYIEVDANAITPGLQELISILKKEVHESFYAVQYVEKGIIYIHGKLPDLVKEYLESKFRDLPEIKFIVANSVILEGMNLPIDTLYILNTRTLLGKELTNLIGRVNRLNTIFSDDDGNLGKLLPKVHFLNNEVFNKKTSSMTSKIEMLRSRSFLDTIENPLLEHFDFSKLKINLDQKKRKQDHYDAIKRNEELLEQSPEREVERIKQYLVESGIDNFYSDLDRLSTVFTTRKESIVTNPSWTTIDVVEKIWTMFVDDIDFIVDAEFARLRYPEARAYYSNHIFINQRRALKQNINYTFNYFKSRVEEKKGPMFFGSTYGEQSIDPNDIDSSSKLYVDLALKSETELVNLAIVKLKIEDDFVSFKLNKFIVMLYDYELITNDEYNECIYGTTDQRKIELTKVGLNISLINRLEAENQLQNIYLDEFNNLKAKPEFENYKRSVDDFYRFELERFLA